MKKTVLLTCLMTVVLTVNAYNVAYSYDAAGNRIKRETKTDLVLQSMRSLPEQISTHSMLGEIEVRFSPNPTEGMLHVTVNTDKENIGAIHIYSTSGTLIQQYSNTTSADFDLSGQQSGIYLLLVEVNGENQVYKIIKK